ncbi:uncharacterized protein LOC117334746 isoform X2 [Pecten maximus]|uniref:uncharacterized protein LOC117334746 isoform X2 n=1 Tax=Pecten maximus TaxID=6579 RepID=UPI001458BDF9|nr:uncharacterized protein LOC117334746 isoform X2 [Pecten maximus]
MDWVAKCSGNQDVFQLPASRVSDENVRDIANHDNASSTISEGPDACRMSDIGSTFRSENFEEIRKSLEEICASITTSEDEINEEFEESCSPKHNNTFPTSNDASDEPRPVSVQSQPDTSSKTVSEARLPVNVQSNPDTSSKTVSEARLPVNVQSNPDTSSKTVSEARLPVNVQSHLVTASKTSSKVRLSVNVQR